LPPLPAERITDEAHGALAVLAVLAQRAESSDALADLRPQLISTEGPGILQASLRAAVRNQGLVAYRLNPDFADLLRELAAGHPVVVYHNDRELLRSNWRFSLLTGYDLEQEKLRRLAVGPQDAVLPWARFGPGWAQGGYWSFVAVPPSQLPTTAQEIAWLRAVNELERDGLLPAAATGYRTALTYWPQQTIGALGLANTLLASGDFAGAEDVLRTRLGIEPQRHELWNNLAHVLVARQCGRQARAAAACAQALAPNALTYQRTLNMASAAAKTGETCQILPPCPANSLVATNH